MFFISNQKPVKTIKRSINLKISDLSCLSLCYKFNDCLVVHEIRKYIIEEDISIKTCNMYDQVELSEIMLEDYSFSYFKYPKNMVVRSNTRYSNPYKNKTIKNRYMFLCFQECLLDFECESISFYSDFTDECYFNKRNVSQLIVEPSNERNGWFTYLKPHYYSMREIDTDNRVIRF